MNFVIRHGPRAHFRFAPLQSKVGQRLLREHALPTEDWDTFVLIDGADHYREFGKIIDRCLAPNGRGLMQSIARNRAAASNSWVQRRIFPDAHLPTLREMMDLFEPSGFCVLDVENLRLHYAKTLMHWLERFESVTEQVAEMFDEQFVRVWRLYLAGSQAGFTTGALDLLQVIFARPGINTIPWTRDTRTR